VRTGALLLLLPTSQVTGNRYPKQGALDWLAALLGDECASIDSRSGGLSD